MVPNLGTGRAHDEFSCTTARRSGLVALDGWIFTTRTVHSLISILQEERYFEQPCDKSMEVDGESRRLICMQVSTESMQD